MQITAENLTGWISGNPAQPGAILPECGALRLSRLRRLKNMLACENPSGAHTLACITIT